jgi:hypothetical protein
MADRSPPLLGAMNIEHRTLNIERRMKEREVNSSQGEVISESPDYAGTLKSDSLNPLASHGHGGLESTTPWGMMNIGRFAVVRWSGKSGCGECGLFRPNAIDFLSGSVGQLRYVVFGC